MRIKFINKDFNNDIISRDAIFIGAIGYEERSYYLYRKFKDKIDKSNIVLFAFKDYISRTDKKDRIEQEETSGIKLIDALYDQYSLFYGTVKDLLKQKKQSKKGIEVHFDYSYMPRRWYCALPKLLESYLDVNDKVYFWYSEGKYPENYQQYPCGGINTYHTFSGKISLRSNIRRTHIVGLSYDRIRTEGLLTILDPEAFIVCDAYDSSTREIHNNVVSLNENIISRAEISISLHMDDFHFMLSKLCEVVNELLPSNDVVLVPDGPKPLIFAFSLIPYLINKPGVTCLHVLRNNNQVDSFDVVANEKIIGFSAVFDGR